MIESSVLILSLLSLKGVGPTRIVDLARPYLGCNYENFVKSLKLNLSDRIEELKSYIPLIKDKIAKKQNERD